MIGRIQAASRIAIDASSGAVPSSIHVYRSRSTRPRKCCTTVRRTRSESRSYRTIWSHYSPPSLFGTSSTSTSGTYTTTHTRPRTGTGTGTGTGALRHCNASQSPTSCCYFTIPSRRIEPASSTCCGDWNRYQSLSDGMNGIRARYMSSSANSYDIEAMVRSLLLRPKNSINVPAQPLPTPSNKEEGRTAATGLKLAPQFFGTGGYVAVMDSDPQQEEEQEDRHTDTTSSLTDRSAFQDAATVIRHYGGTRGSSSSVRLMSGTSTWRSHTSTGIANPQDQLLPLVPTEIMMITSSSASRVRLTPAEICYSVLLGYVLPMERGTRFVDDTTSTGASINDDDSETKYDVDVAIELAGLTIQALIRESKPGKGFRLGGEGDAIASTASASDGSMHSNRDALRNAKLADEVLRRLVTAQVTASRTTHRSYTGTLVNKRETAMTRAYNMALNAWSVAAANAPAAAAREAALRAERLLLEMAKSSDVEGDSATADCDCDGDGSGHVDDWLGVSLDSHVENAQYLLEHVEARTVSFNTVMTAWAKSVRGSEGNNKRSRTRRGRDKPLSRKDGVYAAKRAEAILRLMIDISNEDGESDVWPTAASFSIVMHAWSKSGHPEAPSKVLNLLRDMESRSIPPTAQSYVALMTSFSRSDSDDAVREADQVFSRIPKDITNTELCNALIGAHARVKKRSWEDRHASCRRIDNIIEQMSSDECSFSEPVVPDRITYGTAIMAWSMLAADGAADGTEPLRIIRECAERARDHFEDLLHTCEHMQIPHGISIHNLNDILRAYAAARVPAEGENVFRLALQNRPITPRPDSTSYGLIVQAHANCATHEALAPEMALYWLRQFEETIPEKSRTYDFTDTKLWNAVIDAFCTRNNVEMAEELLQEIIQRYERSISESRGEVRAPRPNTHSFASILSAYLRLAQKEPSKVGEYARRAEALIDTMEKIHYQSRQYAQTLKRLSKVQTNSAVYNTLLSIYSKAEDVQVYLEKSEDVFERMKRVYMEGNESCAPDKYTLSTLLTIYTKSTVLEGSDAGAAKAIELLRKVQSASPDVQLDSTVFNAILRNIASADLETAEEFFTTGMPERNAASYSILISSCSKLGTEEGANRALELFDDLESSEKISVDATIIAHVLLSQLNLKDSPTRVHDFLLEIESHHGSMLQTRHYNIALQACAEADTGCSEALPVALGLFKKMNQSDTITETDGTYSNMLKAFSRHMPADDKRKTDVLVGLFKRACASGWVSFYVYDSFRRATKPAVYKNILKQGAGGSVSYKSIPQKWKRRCS